MPAPPKPWERSGAADSANPVSSGLADANESAPAVPERPSAITSTTDTGPYRSGMGNYGGYGSSYTSPYSRFGGYGGMGYGGMGYGGMGYGGMGYGGMGYGGMGYGGMGYGGMGYGGYGGMGFGQPGDSSLTQRMESGTAATFELLSSIVAAFGGFAQMLESTFMATHSSFFAMVGVADQFAHLRSYLGQVLSIFALARQLKNLYLRMVGRSPIAGIDAREFGDFKKYGTQVSGKRPNRRPLLVFFLAVIGLPYLMGKLVKLITAKQDAERSRLAQQAAEAGTNLQQLQDAQGSGMIDPSKLTFVRSRFAYSAADNLELSLKPNEIVAVLSKTNPQTGEESQWWRGRTRDGRIGWFPSTYVETLEEARDRAKKVSNAHKIEGTPSSASTSQAKVAATKT